jgi:hypothetical protein
MPLEDGSLGHRLPHLGHLDLDDAAFRHALRVYDVGAARCRIGGPRSPA